MEKWRTPEATDGEGGTMEIIPGKAGHYKLRDCAANWRTPMASDSYSYPDTRGGVSIDKLASQAAHWPTPAHRDYKGFDGTGKKNPIRPYAAYFPLPETTAENGHGCSVKCRRLNPQFANWLMGLPPNWDSLATGCALPETEWCRWWRQLRSALCGNG